MGFFDIFKTKKQDNFNIKKEEVKTLEKAQELLEIGSNELHVILNQLNIVPQGDTITESQFNAVYDYMLRSKIPAEEEAEEKRQDNCGAAELDEAITRSIIPASGDVVRTLSGKEYVLGKILGSPGHEGTVYEIKNAAGRAAKIYNESHCTLRTLNKIKLMISKRLNYNGICFPLEILNNINGEFTGFIMTKAEGIRVSNMIKMPKSEFEEKFEACEKRDLVELAITILNKIKYLHDHDVIMGDISLDNIMFTTSDDVYLVDTDSYQFGAYPCRTRTDDFTAPELLGIDLRNTLRDKSAENFAIAVMLFMLMMQGKHPYAHKGGSYSIADIKAGIFPYGAGERSVKINNAKDLKDFRDIQPEGPYRFIWSHLTRKLKNAFYDTFSSDGLHYKPEKRYSVKAWLNLMNAYYKALPKMTENDPESGKVYPKGLKKSRSIKYITCSVCHNNMPEDRFNDENIAICKACERRLS